MVKFTHSEAHLRDYIRIQLAATFTVLAGLGITDGFGTLANILLGGLLLAAAFFLGAVFELGAFRFLAAQLVRARLLLCSRVNFEGGDLGGELIGRLRALMSLLVEALGLLKLVLELFGVVAVGKAHRKELMMGSTLAQVRRGHVDPGFVTADARLQIHAINDQMVSANLVGLFTAHEDAAKAGL